MGMQWPMCLVYRMEDNTVLSVSRKKLVCHEGMYAYFDPTKAQVLKATITELDPEKETRQLQQDTSTDDTQHLEPSNEDHIKGVHSIKVIRDHQSTPQ